MEVYPFSLTPSTITEVLLLIVSRRLIKQTLIRLSLDRVNYKKEDMPSADCVFYFFSFRMLDALYFVGLAYFF